MHKIKRVSLFFSLLFQLIFLSYPFLLVLFWMNAPTPIPLGPASLGFSLSFIPDNFTIYDYYKNLHSLNLSTKCYGLIISLIPFTIAELILYFLIKLFNLYQKGQIFSLQNVTYLKKIGVVLFIGQLMNPFYQALMTLNLSWHSHPTYIAINFNRANFGILLTALLVILIAWIMAEGCQLQEERQLTI